VLVFAAFKGLEELDSVAERVSHVRSSVASEWLVFDDAHIRSTTALEESRKVPDAECWMRLLSRMEISVDSQMKLSRADCEPDTAARCEVARLGYLAKAEDPAVEIARPLFFPGWHSDLDMIQVADVHDPSVDSRTDSAVPNAD
jgi:hypothetical protein